MADLHLNYENPRKVEGVTIEVTGGRKLQDLDPESFRVEKMYFAKNGKEEDRTTLYYNSHITIKNIPLKAYDYQVNGKSPIDWMIEFYRSNANKKFEENGIVNDANAWGIEHNNPRYILELLINLIYVSCRTVDLVEALPRVSFEQKE